MSDNKKSIAKELMATINHQLHFKFNPNPNNTESPSILLTHSNFTEYINEFTEQIIEGYKSKYGEIEIIDVYDFEKEYYNYSMDSLSIENKLLQKKFLNHLQGIIESNEQKSKTYDSQFTNREKLILLYKIMDNRDKFDQLTINIKSQIIAEVIGASSDNLRKWHPINEGYGKREENKAQQKTIDKFWTGLVDKHG